MSNHEFSDEELVEEKLGLMTAYRWHHDPKTLLFILARYHFVARTLNGYGSVLEVGCADAFGSRIVRQAVGSLTALDIDEKMIEGAKKNQNPKWDIDLIYGEMRNLRMTFDALYALDVLEHVDPGNESVFMEEAATLAPVCIIGMPSLESQPYGHPFSKANHVNCKTEEGLRETMAKHYRHVFIFGMNDATLHQGFGPMCQYRFALGIR